MTTQALTRPPERGRPSVRRRFAPLFVAVFTCLALLAPTGVAEATDAPFTQEDGKQIADAAEIRGSNGLNIGPDGLVYVASVAGDEIVVLDPNTGKVLDRIGPERGVNGPDDVVIAADGTIYWTEIIAGNVGMLPPDGSPKIQFVGPGVNPITLGPDGRVYVARIFLGDGLYELDAQLEDPPKLLIADTRLDPEGPLPGGLNGMDFGPDGYLYAPAQFAGAIVRVDVDAASPELEFVTDGLFGPTAIKFNSEGVPYTVDLSRGAVLRLDFENGEHEVVAEVEGTIDNLAFNEDDDLFFAYGVNGQAMRVTNGGVPRELGPAGLTTPGGVAIGADGRVWVADQFSLRGYGGAKHPELSYYDRFAPPGVAFSGANTVAADGDNLIVTSAFAGNVQVIEPSTGALVEDIRSVPLPVNAIRHGDSIVASSGAFGTVVDAYTGDVLVGGALPLGLASDGTTLYVSDYFFGTITALGPDGSSIIAAGLANPEGIAIDGDQLLVVEEGKDRVVSVDPSTGDITPMITGLNLGIRPIPGFLPHGVPSGVAVDDATGFIYVSVDGDNTVYEFKRRR